MGKRRTDRKEKRIRAISPPAGGRSGCTRGHGWHARRRGTWHVVACPGSLSLSFSSPVGSPLARSCGGSGNACSSGRRSGAPRRDCRRARRSEKIIRWPHPHRLCSPPAHVTMLLVILKTSPASSTPPSPADCRDYRLSAYIAVFNIVSSLKL